MPGPTKGFGGQYGDAWSGGTQILEVRKWSFTPKQKLGKVVTNATGGFEGQIRGAPSGKGRITIVIPASGYVVPIVMAATTTQLNLYADPAKAHGFTDMEVEFDTGTVETDLNSDNAVEISIDFATNRPYNAIGAFAILGTLNTVATSSSSSSGSGA